MATTLTRLYTTKELARMLGESEWAIQDWVRRRGLPVIKIGNRNRFDLAQVRAWLDADGMPAAIVGAVPLRYDTTGMRRVESRRTPSSLGVNPQ